MRELTMAERKAWTSWTTWSTWPKVETFELNIRRRVCLLQFQWRTSAQLKINHQSEKWAASPSACPQLQAKVVQRCCMCWATNRAPTSTWIWTSISTSKTRVLRHRTYSTKYSNLKSQSRWNNNILIKRGTSSEIKTWLRSPTSKTPRTLIWQYLSMTIQKSSSFWAYRKAMPTVWKVWRKISNRAIYRSRTFITICKIWILPSSREKCLCWTRVIRNHRPKFQTSITIIELWITSRARTSAAWYRSRTRIQINRWLFHKTIWQNKQIQLKSLSLARRISGYKIWKVGSRGIWGPRRYLWTWNRSSKCQWWARMQIPLKTSGLNQVIQSLVNWSQSPKSSEITSRYKINRLSQIIRPSMTKQARTTSRPTTTASSQWPPPPYSISQTFAKHYNQRRVRNPTSACHQSSWIKW